MILTDNIRLPFVARTHCVSYPCLTSLSLSSKQSRPIANDTIRAMTPNPPHFRANTQPKPITAIPTAFLVILSLLLMRLIVRGNPCLQAGEETHNFLLNRETINEFDILLNFSFLYEIPALTLVPSNLRISNEPDFLLPKMKHSKLSYSTLSNRRNPFTRYRAWFFLLIPPFRVFAL